MCSVLSRVFRNLKRPEIHSLHLSETQSVSLPRTFNAKRLQPGGFALVHVVLNHAIHAAAARSAAQAGPQLGQVGHGALGHHLHLALFGVAHPAAQVQFAGLPLYVPPEANPLHSPLNQKM